MAKICQIIICVSSEKLSKIPFIIPAKNQMNWNNQNMNNLHNINTIALSSVIYLIQESNILPNEELSLKLLNDF